MIYSLKPFELSEIRVVPDSIDEISSKLIEILSKDTYDVIVLPTNIWVMLDVTNRLSLIDKKLDGTGKSLKHHVILPANIFTAFNISAMKNFSEKHLNPNDFFLEFFLSQNVQLEDPRLINFFILIEDEN